MHNQKGRRGAMASPVSPDPSVWVPRRAVQKAAAAASGASLATDQAANSRQPNSRRAFRSKCTHAAENDAGQLLEQGSACWHGRLAWACIAHCKRARGVSPASSRHAAPTCTAPASREQRAVAGAPVEHGGPSGAAGRGHQHRLRAGEAEEGAGSRLPGRMPGPAQCCPCAKYTCTTEQAWLAARRAWRARCAGGRGPYLPGRCQPLLAAQRVVAPDAHRAVGGAGHQQAAVQLVQL